MTGKSGEGETREALRALAQRIARDLFTNGQGQHATRLVLVDDGPNNLGGWGEKPMADRIEKMLVDALDAVLSTAGGLTYEDGIRDAQRAVVEACESCGGQGQVLTVETGYGHACDGSEASCAANCPVPIPVEGAERCEYCGRPSDAIRKLLAVSPSAHRERGEQE